MNNEEIRYQQAKERVEALKGFYIHLTVYVIVNLFLFILNILFSPDSLWFFWPLVGWGIAVVLHAVSVFGSGYLSGTAWEERKIKEIMEGYDDTNASS